MPNRSTLWATLGGAGLVAVCCGAPLLAGAIGALGFSALLAWGTRILPVVGLAIVAATLVFYLRFRRAHAPSSWCGDRSVTPSGNPR